MSAEHREQRLKKLTQKFPSYPIEDPNPQVVYQSPEVVPAKQINFCPCCGFDLRTIKEMSEMITVEKITPAQARKWLEIGKYEKQRKLRHGHIDRLRNDMNAGRWRMSNDAITLVGDRLLNGQHRLVALSESKVPYLEFLVLRTDSEDIYKHIDTGAKRTIADTMPDVVSASVIASAASIVLDYDNKSLKLYSQKWCYASRAEIISFLEKRTVVPKLSEAAAFVMEARNGQPKLFPVAIATAFLYVASRDDEEGAQRFIKSVYSGFQTTNSVLELRNALIQQMKRGATKNHRHDIFAMAIKAYNKQSTRLSRNEAFPRLDVEKVAA